VAGVHRSAQETRASLWARYDEGELGTDELDARLRAVDRAGDDPLALEQAFEGPVRAPNPRRRRWLGVAAAGGAAVLLVVVAVALVGDVGGGSGNGNGNGNGGTAVPLPQPVPGLPVDPEPVECDALDDALERLEGIDGTEAPANPAALSDPPALPDGYTVADEVSLVPGSDPDLSMNISAGTPLPVEITARQLLGPLTVTMRSFTYESPEAAGESGLSVVDDAFCVYEATSFTVPDRPEITGTTVSGVIPTTAFASWRLAERRFTVSVQAADVDGLGAGPDETAEAEALAGAIAGLELDAARAGP
jgi:hypothetical protein